MFPTLRLKLVKGGSILCVPLFWSLINLLILLALCIFSLSFVLDWWLYILMVFSFFSLLDQEKWFYDIERNTLNYRKGIVGWLREESFNQKDLEGVFQKSIGRYWILVLKVGEREWEIERSPRKIYLDLLQNQIIKQWKLKSLG